MKKWRSPLLWLLSLLLTAALGIYQRRTGPTYPLRGQDEVFGQIVKYKFIRSNEIQKSLPVEVLAPGRSLEGTVSYRPYRTTKHPGEMPMVRDGDRLKAAIPPARPWAVKAGKLEYSVRVWLPGRDPVTLYGGRSVVARFKGHVPFWLLIIHILFMFAGMLLAFRAGMEALRRDGRHSGLVTATLIVTAIGGLVLGPIIQKMAFGLLWSGFPLGWDFTDTKTLLALALWFIAFLMRKKSRWWVVAALVLMIGVYLVPHSFFGSELDFQTGRVITGRMP